MTRLVFLKLLPLLVLYYIVFATGAHSAPDYGDEARYVMYAENLTQGFYAPRDSRLLWNGPGYPLLLAPFALFDVPWIYAKMLNPLFIFLAVCFFFAALRGFMSEKVSLLAAYLFGLYPPFFAEVWYLLTEPFSLMLIALFSLLIVNWLATARMRFILPAAIVFAILALTKVFFGYVALGLLLLSSAVSMWNATARRVLPVYLLALLLCAPYLFYTYRLTGKVFCWANSGGSVLYWMTSPDPNDFGSWFTDTDVLTRPELAGHKAFFEKLQGLDYVQRDDLMKKQALENIRNNPRKVLLNYAANLGRLFLNFPFSYKSQHPRTLLYIVPNGLILGAIVFSLYPLIKLRRHLPPAIFHACAISVVYIAGQTPLYAEARYLCPILPFVLMVVAYVATNLIVVRNPAEQQ